MEGLKCLTTHDNRNHNSYSGNNCARCEEICDGESGDNNGEEGFTNMCSELVSGVKIFEIFGEHHCEKMEYRLRSRSMENDKNEVNVYDYSSGELV